MLRLEEGKVWLCDLDSKFGTFLQIKTCFPLDQSIMPLPITIEKKCFFMKLEPRFSQFKRMMMCCTRNYPFENNDHYYKYMDKFPVKIREQLMPHITHAEVVKQMEDK